MLKLIVAMALVLAPQSQAIEYHVARVNANDVKLVSNKACILFDVPDVGEVRVDGLSIPPGSFYYTPELPNPDRYFYEVSFAKERKPNLVFFQRGELAIVMSQDSLLTKPKPNLKPRKLHYEKLFPVRAIPKGSALVIMLNPPGTQVRVGERLFGDTEFFSYFNVTASDEETEANIEILGDQGRVLDRIKVRARSGERLLIAYSEVFVKLEKKIQPSSPTTNLFLTPAKEIDP